LRAAIALLALIGSSTLLATVLAVVAYGATGWRVSDSRLGPAYCSDAAVRWDVAENRKELGRILLAHGDVYVAQTTAAHLNHFYRSIIEANEFPGPAVVIVYAPCPPEHGIADDLANRQSRLAVDSRAFPLFTYDPRRGPSIASRLSLQGNPALRDNWSTLPDGSTYDFIAFARTEGRFRPHFAGDGSVSAELQASAQERLANWRTLQELAGIKPASEDSPA